MSTPDLGDRHGGKVLVFASTLLLALALAECGRRDGPVEVKPEDPALVEAHPSPLDRPSRPDWHRHPEAPR